MIFMAQISHLLSESMVKEANSEYIKDQAEQIGSDLMKWWQSCYPAVRDQGNNWRQIIRPQRLSILETLEEEAFSKLRSYLYACIIYLNYILNPFGHEPQKFEVTNAIKEILETVKEVPKGHRLEVGHY
jgi:hypothetical protein